MNSSIPLNERRSHHQNYVQSVWNKRALKQEQRLSRRANLKKAIETSLKLSANVGLSVLAIVSFKQLLPYHQVQQEKLAEIDFEIEKIQPRVAKLEENFGTTFDPLLSRKITQKNTYKVDPNVSPIFFVKQNEQKK